MITNPIPIDNEHRIPLDPIAELSQQGIESVLISNEENLKSISPRNMPSIALVDTATMVISSVMQCVQRCSDLRLPTVALLNKESVSELDHYLQFDDFVLMPPRPGELVTRVRWVLNQKAKHDGDNLVRVGDLIINPTRYEVSVSGRRVNLRFKEYELLLLMATSPGRVFTRETLLNQIWGYEYLGGTRTVDVHVRRLRSKIEDADRQYIETVWQVGYRFKDIDEAK